MKCRVKKAIRNFLQLILLVCMMQHGFFFTYVSAWLLLGFPLTRVASLFFVIIAGASNWLLIKWIEGSEYK